LEIVVFPVRVGIERKGDFPIITGAQRGSVKLEGVGFSFFQAGERQSAEVVGQIAGIERKTVVKIFGTRR